MAAEAGTPGPGATVLLDIQSEGDQRQSRNIHRQTTGIALFAERPNDHLPVHGLQHKMGSRDLIWLPSASCPHRGAARDSFPGSK